MTPTQLHILRHSLGLDAHSHGRPYRNHYVAGGDDVAVCDGLVEIECMSRRVGSELSGGAPIYHVTEKGRDAAAPTTRPKKPTRYQVWLKLADAFSAWNFGDWLKAGCPGEKETRERVG